MVKLRLARQGRKKVPIYKIVAADSRARRDGRFIEALGQYRPSNEAGQKLQIQEDRALYWLGVGAQPTDTVRSLLSKEGIMLKWHLSKKNVEPARAEEILTTWKGQRDAKLAANQDAKARARDEAKRKAVAAKKAAEEAAAAAEASIAAAAAAEAKVVEAPASEAKIAEAPAAEAPATEAPAAEVSAEQPMGVPGPEGTPGAERQAESVEG